MKITKDQKVLLWAGLAIVGYVIYSKLRAVSNLIFAAGDVQKVSFQGSTTVIELTVQVQNTADTSVSIQSFAGNVTLNGSRVGNISSFTPVTISANSMTVVPLQLQLGAFQAVQQIISAWTNHTTQAKINITGAANGLGFQAPIDIDFTIG